MFNLHELWEHLKAPTAAEKLEKAGDILQYALTWFALIWIVLCTSGPITNLAGSLWILTNLACVLVVAGLKYASNYTRFGVRPNGGKNSFPSGHTASAFMGPMFIHALFGFSFVVSILYGLAVLTGVSRVAARKHWVRDTVGGAIISGMICWWGTYVLAVPALYLLAFIAS